MKKRVNEFPTSGGVPRPRPGRGGQCRQEVNERAAKNYFALPYNSDLKQRAKALRKAGNLPEVLMWKQLKKSPFDQLDFDRQKIIGNYIVDFYCTNKNVVLEIDGQSHTTKVEYDERRDLYLNSLGLEVIHITAKDVLQNMDGVVEFLTIKFGFV
jgi:very-short-patch-repair endonuclease